MSEHDDRLDPARRLTRREMLAAAATAAAAVGAALAWPRRIAYTATAPTERRDLFPQGVASGDPHPDSVLVWTRRPPVGGSRATTLRVEVATDDTFHRVVSVGATTLSSDTDWTCRVLAAGLRPAQTYWYRFVDDHGFASRVGRTITAPAAGDERPVRFAFVSCQNVQLGGQQAYRRMMWEDSHAPPDARLEFVLHLGDFFYEVVWYPEDRPQGMYARRVRDVVRYAHGEKHADFHVPTTVDDYRALFVAYLADPDVQDARARWPFVCMWDNHEFSWKGWQSQETFGRRVVPAQTRKVAAAQAWYEFQPARVARVKGGTAGGGVMPAFAPPRVEDRPIERFDANGLGLDAGNLAAIHALTLYRTFRWGRHVELVLTDNRSFRAQPITDRPEMAPFVPSGFPLFLPQDVIEVLDAGRAANGGNPPRTIAFAGANVPNPRADEPPTSMLGAEQKAWFFDQLRHSTARWKLWGNTVATLDWRTDCPNVPSDVRGRWPTTGYGQLGDDDWTGYRTERAEILEFIRTSGITGVVSLAGDRHAFQAGVLSRSLPPNEYMPVAVEFVTGSISAPGLFEAAEYAVPREHPLRPLYAYDALNGSVGPAINVTLMHGVLASIELQRTHDPQAALAVRQADVAPHLAFMDAGGHGYAVVRATADVLDVEFVAIPRPVERVDAEDGGPLAYRVTHRVAMWSRAAAPRVERTRVAGELPLVL